nr:MAG TPA: hypothetical protein [Crassvirales sp.]DAR58531.1 MAG TPA: hypothetical protein [Crassvirales sp.]
MVKTNNIGQSAAEYLYNDKDKGSTTSRKT